MLDIKLCLFSSTPDIDRLNFLVKVLTGTPQELANQAVGWGYDGIEFMPDPENVPDPQIMQTALQNSGAVMPVVNSGRMAVQGMALLHDDKAVRDRSIAAFKRMLDFASPFDARVGLGIARGTQPTQASPEELNARGEDVFRELAEYAGQVGVVIMLEPADPGAAAFIHTVAEAMNWVDKINHSAFTVMLDTYQLADSETSIESGIRAARGQANHIHLYDPSRWPPGVLAEGDRLDWPHIGRVLGEEGFQGTGSVVLAPEGDPEPAARTALAYLRDLFSQSD